MRSVRPWRFDAGRGRDWVGVAGLLVLGAITPGCRSTPEARPAMAEVTVPRMSRAALGEIVGLHMRAHDWRFVRKEPNLLVYERRVMSPLKSWLGNEESSPVALRAEITLTPVNDGIRLDGATQRIDTSKKPPRVTAESPKELQRILEEIREGMGGR